MYHVKHFIHEDECNTIAWYVTYCSPPMRYTHTCDKAGVIGKGKRHHRCEEMSLPEARGVGRRLAITVTELLLRGTSSSTELTHLHTRAPRKTRALTHSPAKYKRPPRDPARAVFYPSSQFPLGGTEVF